MRRKRKVTITRLYNNMSKKKYYNIIIRKDLSQLTKYPHTYYGALRWATATLKEPEKYLAQEVLITSYIWPEYLVLNVFDMFGTKNTGHDQNTHSEAWWWMHCALGLCFFSHQASAKNINILHGEKIHLLAQKQPKAYVRINKGMALPKKKKP